MNEYSIYMALILTYFGSSNKTEKELYNALNLNWTDDKNNIEKYYKYITRRFIYIDTEIKFYSANQIFLDEGQKLRSCIKAIFSDDLQNIDFAKNPEESRKKINNWVSLETNNSIPEFLQNGDISSETNMILASAAYFKGKWYTKFDKKNTKVEIFYSGFEKRSLVAMIYSKENYYFGISEELGCLLLDLEYKGGSRDLVSMIILLPPITTNVNTLLNNLTPENLENAINDCELREIEVALPKFTFEQRLDLLPILNEIGIKEVFSNKADFSTFSDNGNFALHNAIHFAKIEVDEESVTPLFSFPSAQPVEITEFKCNHPFLFLLYDHKSKLILFTGIYRGPQ